MSFEEDIKLVKKLPREKLEELYHMLLQYEWNTLSGVSLKDLVTSCLNKKIDNIEIEKMGVEDDVVELANIRESNYNDEDSEKFMRKVLASNVTEIADSGYFYKKLNAALDDFVMADADTCGSTGETYPLYKPRETNNILNYNQDGFISEEFFNYYLKNSYVRFDDENDEVAFDDYDAFVSSARDHKKVTVFDPLNCEYAPKRCLCRRCVGILNNGGRLMGTKNIGVLTSFCITEPVTQASLSSMNKGITKSPNKVLEESLPIIDKRFTWEEAQEAIRNVINSMFTSDFISHSKFYQISIMGKIFQAEDGKYFQTSFKNCSKYTKDKFSSFLFNSSINNMKGLVSHTGSRKLEGIKSKLLFCKED